MIILLILLPLIVALIPVCVKSIIAVKNTRILNCVESVNGAYSIHRNENTKDVDNVISDADNTLKRYGINNFDICNFYETLK